VFVDIGWWGGDSPVVELAPGSRRAGFFDSDGGDALFGEDSGKDGEALGEAVHDEYVIGGGSKSSDSAEVVGQLGPEWFVTSRVAIVKIGVR